MNEQVTSNQRDAFELWAEGNHWNTRRNPYNQDMYQSDYTQYGWWAWKAARAAVEPTEDRKRLMHYWKFCNVLTHPSYMDFQDWLKKLDEDMAERCPTETKSEYSQSEQDCKGCDGPCGQCTAGETSEGRLPGEAAEICQNCDAPMPKGCEGVFQRTDGAACLLNRPKAAP